MKMLKLLFLALLFTSCAQHYEKYDVIEKRSFKMGESHSPITPKMLPKNKERKEICEGQFFFTKNAKKMTEQALTRAIQYMCFDSNYLLNATITDTWWTTIIYSRSCIEIEASCPISSSMRQ